MQKTLAKSHFRGYFARAQACIQFIVLLDLTAYLHGSSNEGLPSKAFYRQGFLLDEAFYGSRHAVRLIGGRNLPCAFLTTLQTVFHGKAVFYSA